MSIIACNRRHVHEHVDRIMGHLVVNSGIRCQVILVKREPREPEKWRTIGTRYTYCVVVTISKVLDLVGIPSIFWVRGCFFEERRDLLLDWRQPVTAPRIDSSQG